MCLILKVKLSEQDSAHSAEIAKLASEISDVDICLAHPSLTQSWFRKNLSVLKISEHNEGCACSLLTDNADWDAPTWDMHKINLPKIARGLIELRQQAQNGFAFEALWEGEKPTEEIELSIDDLAKIIESGKIGTKTKYLVN